MFTCSACQEEKPESEFSPSPKKKRGYSNKCKSCVNIYSKEHYNKNRTKYREQQESRRKQNIHRIDEIRKSNPCTVCGQDKYYMLCFHHRDKTEKEFSIGMSTNFSWKRLEAEIDKCDIMCSNCHIEYHHINGY